MLDRLLKEIGNIRKEINSLRQLLVTIVQAVVTSKPVQTVKRIEVELEERGQRGLSQGRKKIIPYIK